MLELHDRKSRRLEVIYRPISDIKPDPNNPRTHPKSQVSQIAVSIGAFGFINPVLIDENGVIIAGHGRLLAAKQLGMTEAPTITLIGLSPAEKIALRIADNKMAQGSGWNRDLLQVQIAEIRSMDVKFDTTVTGFSVGEIDVLMTPKPDTKALDEALPEKPPEPRAKRGDVWILGDHRVGCGDCRDLPFLQRVIGADSKVDAAFLDPPYNVSITNHANVRSKHREFEVASDVTPVSHPAITRVLW